MGVFVIVALAVMVVAAGAAAVAALTLLGAWRHLRDAVAATTERVGPLVDDLDAEAATAALELDAIARRLGDGAARRTRPPGGGGRSATRPPG